MSGQLRVEEDRVRGGPLAVAIASSVAVTCGGAFVGWLALAAGERGAPRFEPVAAPRQIHVGLIEEERTGPREREQARRELDRWSWVDRERGVVAIPIRRAIELLARPGSAGGGR